MTVYTRTDVLPVFGFIGLGAVAGWQAISFSTAAGIDTIVSTNSDGTSTRIVGSNFVLDPLTHVPSAGVITSIAHLDADLNRTVLESYTSVPATFSLVELYNHILSFDFEPFIFATADTLNGGAQADVLNGFAGSDTINGGGGDDVIDGGNGADTINGGAGADTLDGGNGLDTIFGGAGNDIITSSDGQGADIIDGGANIDQATIDRSGLLGNITADFSNFLNQVTLLDGTQIVNVESIAFFSGSGNDTLTASNQIHDPFGAIENILYGGGGNDLLVAGSNAAMLYGGTGNDTLNGNVSDDVLDGGDGDDAIDGAAGADVIDAGSGIDVINAGGGADHIVSIDTDAINGGTGVDTADINRSGLVSGETASFANSLVTVSLSDGSTIINVEKISYHAGSGADKLTASNDAGGLSANVLYGGAGNDTLTASAFGAFLSGDAGEDTLNGGVGYDRLNGGNGNDTIFTGGNSGTFGVELVTGGGGDDHITVNGTGNTLIHGDDPNSFSAVAGNDTIDLSLDGAAFQNTVFGDEGDDIIIGGSSNDTAGYSGLRSGYSIERTDGAATTWLVTDTLLFDGNDGHDTLTGVETLRFGGFTQLDVANLIGALSDQDTTTFNNFVQGGSSTGTASGVTASAQDGSGDGVTYSLANDAGGRFQIDATTGAVTVANGALLNSAMATSHDIVVMATSADGSFVQKTFSIGVTNGNAPPVAMSLDTATASENASNGSLVGTLSAIALDSGDTQTYVLLDDAGGRFAISGHQLTVANGLLLDFEQAAIHNVTVRVTDSGGLSFDRSFAIAVGNVDPENVVGDAAENIFVGGALADTLNGGGGADSLTGGWGKDTLTGGLGADVFDFNKVRDSIKSIATRDVITDFVHGEDKIDLFDIDANANTIKNNAFVFVGKAAFSNVAGELRFTKIDAVGTANDMTVVAGDINGDGLADFQVQLAGLVNLTKSDFIL